ncbi:MAG TPA: hypothetical protein VMH03_03050 [Terriglobales bacterium]|nr:hypothetical protein [Terriglobales bacterium]
MATHSFDSKQLTKKEDAVDSAITYPSFIPGAQQSLSETQQQKLTSLGQRMEMLLSKCFGKDEETVANSLRGL